MEYPRSLFAYKGIRRKRGYGVIECNRHNRKWSRLGMANDHSAAWYTYLYDSQDRIIQRFTITKGIRLSVEKDTKKYIHNLDAKDDTPVPVVK